MVEQGDGRLEDDEEAASSASDEPSYSGMRRPSSVRPGRRPTRHSVSAFGPPRSSRPPPPASEAQATEEGEQRASGPVRAVDEAAAHDPFRSADSQPSPRPAPQSPPPPLPEREFEETEVTSPSLLEVRSGLLPIPEDDPRMSSEPPAEAVGTGPIALTMFGFMLLAALAVGVRGWTGQASEPAQGLPAVAPAQTPLAAQQQPDAPQVEAPPVRAAQPGASDAPSAEPREHRLAPEPTEAILQRIDGTLPEEGKSASDALVVYAKTYMEDGRPEVAEALLGRALQFDEHNPRAAARLAELRLQEGNLQGAEGWAARAVDLRPRRARYRLLYGDILQRLQRPAEARRQWRRARRYDPSLEEAKERLEQAHGHD